MGLFSRKKGLKDEDEKYGLSELEATSLSDFIYKDYKKYKSQYKSQHKWHFLGKEFEVLSLYFTDKDFDAIYLKYFRRINIVPSVSTINKTKKHKDHKEHVEALIKQIEKAKRKEDVRRKNIYKEKIMEDVQEKRMDYIKNRDAIDYKHFNFIEATEKDEPGEPQELTLRVGKRSANIIAKALAAYNEFEELEVEMMLAARKIKDFSRLNNREQKLISEREGAL